MKNKDELFINRILDLSQQSETQNIFTSTRFLSPLEQSLFLAMKKDLASASFLTGGSESAIRKIAVFGSAEEMGYSFESPIRILHIKPKAEKFAETLNHRDYLGALMSMGIERELTGDIVIRGKEAWVYVLENIVEYLCENLKQIRHTNVVCELADGDVPELLPVFQTIQFNIASERLDLLIGGAAGISREAAKKLLADEKVFVNGRVITSAGHKLKEGDELVIRGFGKYVYYGTVSVSRKGRNNVVLKKFV